MTHTKSTFSIYQYQAVSQVLHFRFYHALVIALLVIIWFDLMGTMWHCVFMFMFMFIRMFIRFHAWTWFLYESCVLVASVFFFFLLLLGRGHNTSRQCRQRKKETIFLFSQINQCMLFYLISRNRPLCVQIKCVLHFARVVKYKTTTFHPMTFSGAKCLF